jgi:hypothetical protein
VAKKGGHAAPKKKKAGVPLPEGAALDQVIDRLEQRRALEPLVRGGLPQPLLRRLLKSALNPKEARESPVEVWASLAIGIAYRNHEFQDVLAQALHDHLAWDREPASMDEWWQAVRERPLEALWMAALSEQRELRRELDHVVSHCIENYRSSPECAPPSWEYVDGLLSVQAESDLNLRQAEKRMEDAEKRSESDRQRLEDLRDEIKKLRREGSELRAEVAEQRRRLRALEEAPAADPGSPDAARVADLERRLRKTEKEREHLAREVERLGQSGRTGLPDPPAPAEPEEPSAEAEAEEAPDAMAARLAEDPIPRRRVLRQMLRKLVTKGKIGASHTHEDNVYRGVADHEKGLAKEAMEILYREGFFVPKPTTTDPHVSLRPERMPDIEAIIAGEVRNPRLQRFVES